MKFANLIGLALAMLMAALAWWNSEANRQQVQQHIDGMTQQLEEVDRRINALGDLQSLTGIIAEPQATPTPAKTTNPKLKADTNKLTDRVTNQRRANDNQWQAIDSLKSDQQFQKRQIDQINFDVSKLQREIRDLSNRSSKRR